MSNAFKVGDRVRAKADYIGGSGFRLVGGRVYTVTDTRDDFGDHEVRVKEDVRESLYFAESRFERVNTFSIGDKIVAKEDQKGLNTSLKRGQVYTVLDLVGSDYPSVKVDESDRGGGWPATLFDRAAETPFAGVKKGDKLRIVLETVVTDVSKSGAAIDTQHNYFRDKQDDLVSVEVIEKAKPVLLPTTPGTTFKAKVNGVENTWFVRKLASGTIQYLPAVATGNSGPFYQNDLDSGYVTVELL